MTTGVLIVAGIIGAIIGYVVGRCHQALVYWLQFGQKIKRDSRSFRRGPRWK